MSRLLLVREQERSICRESTDTPAAREARIVALCEKYERLGLTGRDGPVRQLSPRDEAEMERRRARDAKCLAMRREGMDTTAIAFAMGLGRTTTQEAIKRAEAAERDGKEHFPMMIAS